MTDTEQVSVADRRSEDQPPSKAPLIGAIILAVIGLVVLGLLLVDPFGGASDEAAEVTHDAVAAEVDVHGDPLPPFDQPANDQAIGMSAPRLEGTGVDGEPLTMDPADGTPRVILFIAHWCPVCQDELPEVQAAREDGRLPDEVDVVAVSTGVREDEENFPPGAWFRDVGWTAPTLIDNDDGHAAGAYGLRAYPYWVFTQGDGVVAGRLSGALEMEDLELLMGELAERQ